MRYNIVRYESSKSWDDDTVIVQEKYLDMSL